MTPLSKARPPRLAAPTLALTLALVVALAPARVAAAQDAPRGGQAPVLSLRQAVERALDDHPAVAAARAERAAAGHALGEAEAARLPLVTAAASGVYNDRPLPTTPIHGFGAGLFPEFDRSLFQGAVTVDYLLTDGGGRRGRIRQGEGRAAAAAAALDGAAQSIAAATAGAYLRVLTEEAVLDAHRRRIAALEAERGRVELRFAAGRAAEVEVRRVEATLAAARAERVRIDAALATARADLARLVGAAPQEIAAGTLVPVALAAPGLPRRHELLAAALADSPRVAAAKAALTTAQAAVTVARALRRPKLHAVANVLGFGSSAGDFQEEWNAGLQLSVPIFAGGAERQRISRAEAERDAAGERLAVAELAVGEALDRALAAVRESAAGADALAEAVAAFAEVVRIERLRRDAGVGTDTDYLEAEADLLTTRARLAEARNGEVAARVELARLTGRLDLSWFDESLLEAQP